VQHQETGVESVQGRYPHQAAPLDLEASSKGGVQWCEVVLACIPLAG
jgi:hypothetical protein